jgi:hypothetical protein
MAPASQAQLLCGASFDFGSNGTGSLDLLASTRKSPGGLLGAQRHGGEPSGARVLGGPRALAFASQPLAAPIGFATRGSRVVARSLTSGSAVAASRRRALPFASLALASATVAAPKPATATKQKKSLGEVLQHAGKRALSGGIPGALAMVSGKCFMLRPAPSPKLCSLLHRPFAPNNLHRWRRCCA